MVSKHCIKGGIELSSWVKEQEGKGYNVNIFGTNTPDFYTLNDINDIYTSWSLENIKKNCILISFEEFKRLYLEKVKIYELW
jgi:hypothetical protein